MSAKNSNYSKNDNLINTLQDCYALKFYWVMYMNYETTLGGWVSENFFIRVQVVASQIASMP